MKNFYKIEKWKRQVMQKMFDEYIHLYRDEIVDCMADDLIESKCITDRFAAFETACHQYDQAGEDELAEYLDRLRLMPKEEDIDWVY